MVKVINPTRSGIVVSLLLFLAAGQLFSQTQGTFSFSVTTTSTGGFSPSHYLAIWIQNASEAFIKTKIAYTNPDDLDHMQTWVTKTGKNTVDAVTGSTLTSHGTISFLWNGTNVAGNVVPDGTYLVWLEMAWAQNLTTGKTVNSYSFTKGAGSFHSTPANTDNFLSIELDWTPLTSGVEGILESNDINVYPNPSKGTLYIDFKKPQTECLLQIINESGMKVYNEKMSDIMEGVRTFDLSGLSSGIYYCSVHFPERVVVFSLILTK